MAVSLKALSGDHSPRWGELPTTYTHCPVVVVPLAQVKVCETGACPSATWKVLAVATAIEPDLAMTRLPPVFYQSTVPPYP